MLLFYATVDFHLFYNGTADMPLMIFIYYIMRQLQLICKYEPQCRVSDTQVTVKAVGPLCKNEGYCPFPSGYRYNNVVLTTNEISSWCLIKSYVPMQYSTQTKILFSFENNPTISFIYVLLLETFCG